jgi:hypothetical protein
VLNYRIFANRIEGPPRVNLISTIRPTCASTCYPAFLTGLGKEQGECVQTAGYLSHPNAATIWAISFGTAGWLSKDSRLGIIVGILCAVGFVAALPEQPCYCH